MNKSKRKPPNYWSDWNNIVSEISPLIADNRFPTINEITSQLGSGICKAIAKFGGIGVVSNKMGHKITSMLITSDGHHVRSSYEYIFDEFLYENNIQHEVDGKIHSSKNYRYDFKIDNYYIEIWGYDIKNSRGKKYIEKRIKKEAFYKELGLKLISLEASDFLIGDTKKVLDNVIKTMGCKPKSNVRIKACTHHFKHWNYDNTLKELKTTIEDIGHFPSKSELTNAKKFGLIYGIYKHGGTTKFQKLLDYPIKASWNDETITTELKTIFKDIGHFPTCTELKSMKKTGLLDSIINLGGINKFRKQMGYSISKNYTKTPWTYKKIEKELKDIINEIEHFPTCDELKSMKKFGLLCASYNFGGISKFRKEMGHPVLKRGPKQQVLDP